MLGANYYWGHVTMKLCIDQFPRTDSIVALFGSRNIDADSSKTPTFLFIVDELEIPLSMWHHENSKNNSHHYTTFARIVYPSVFASAPCTLTFNKDTGEVLYTTGRYIVCAKADLEEALTTWKDFALSQMMMQLSLQMAHGNLKNAKLGFPLAVNAVNKQNALKVALLLSPQSIPIIDLIKFSSSSPDDVDPLLLLHFYHNDMLRVSDDWEMNIEDGDAYILAGRYQPEQYGDNRQGKGERAGEGSKDFKHQHFGWKFENEDDAETVRDLLSKTESDVDRYGLESFHEKFLGLKNSTFKSPEIQDALNVLSRQSLRIKQSYSNIAHCSLFHQLPPIFTAKAASASSWIRLQKMFNPFKMVGNGGEVLGGPLPWEQPCVETAWSDLHRRKTNSEHMVNLVCRNPLRPKIHKLNQGIGGSLLVG